MVDKDKTCNLMTSTTSLVAEKVSEILSTARLEYASILHQGQNIKNSFASTGFMDSPTSMITTARIMRRTSRELYNVIHHTCVGRLCTKIFSLTTYTQLNYTQKYRTFIKTFFTAMNNPINSYHPHLN